MRPYTVSSGIESDSESPYKFAIGVASHLRCNQQIARTELKVSRRQQVLYSRADFQRLARTPAESGVNPGVAWDLRTNQRSHVISRGIEFQVVGKVELGAHQKRVTRSASVAL